MLKKSKDTRAVTRESIESDPRQLQDQNNRPAYYHNQHTATKKKKHTSSHKTTYYIEGTNEAENYVECNLFRTIRYENKIEIWDSDVTEK